MFTHNVLVTSAVMIGATTLIGCHQADDRNADINQEINTEISAGVSADIKHVSALSSHERRLISVFQRASPSVVHITSLSVRRRQRSLFSQRAQQEEGTGSGFVWDREGHIVTNYHVIKGGDAIQVAITPPAGLREDLTPQLTFDAQLVGVAPDRDLAVIRVSAPQALLSPLPRGQSSGLAVGQSALAIGNPFGLDQTLTTGVISGLGREIESVTRYPIKGVIQTDAAINPGNSGGPLLNSAGQVIGVNTAIYSPSGAYAGIGFAVPIDTVSRVIPQLIKYGGEVRPTLNLELEEGLLTRRYRLSGVLILSVPPESEAARAGVRGARWSRRGLSLGDLIIAIDGQRITDTESLYQAIDERQVGDRVRLTLQRGWGSRVQRREVTLTLVGHIDVQRR